MKSTDGVVSTTCTLFESAEEARECAIGMPQWCLDNGRPKDAKDYESAKFAVYPVEFDEPEIEWDDAQQKGGEE